MFGLFRKKFSKLAAKGDKLADGGQPGLARGEYLEALAAWREGEDDAGEKARVERRLADVEVELAHKQMEDARRCLKAGMFDRAFSILESVETLSEGRDEALFAEADELLTKLESGEIGEGAGLPDEEEPEEPAADPSAEFDLLIHTLPEARQEAYHRAGDAFRDAYLLLNDGAAEEALAMLGGAPPGPWVAYESARALVFLERLEEACERFAEAAEVDDALVSPVLVNWVQAASSCGRFEEAEAALERYDAVSPKDDPDGVLLRLRVLAAQERWDELETTARAFLKRNPSRLAVWRGFGGYLEQAGRPIKAIEAYEAVMGLKWRLDPERQVVDLDEFATSRLAQLRIEHGRDLERALTLLNALSLLAGPEEKLGLGLLRARALEKKGDLDGARAALNDVREGLPDLPPEASKLIEDALAGLASGDAST